MGWTREVHGKPLAFFQAVVLCNFETRVVKLAILALPKSADNEPFDVCPGKLLVLLAGVVTARVDMAQARVAALLDGSSATVLPDASVHELTPLARASSFQ